MPREKVLIIDDSAELRASLEAILAFGGYEAVSVGTGQEGLDLAVADQPEAILIDLELPDTSGLKVIEEFNRLGLAIPTIMMTGYGSEGTAARALRLGVRDYLIKPFTTDEVLSSIERALQESRLRRETARLMARLEDHTRFLDLLSKVGPSITSGSDLHDVALQIVAAGQSITRAEAGSLLQLDGTPVHLQVVATSDESDSIPRSLTILAGDKRLRPVLQEGIAVRLQSTGRRAIELQTGDRAMAVLQVPLNLRGRVIGLMTMERRDENVPFTEKDEQMLKILADYAVLALEKAGRAR